MRRLMQLLSNNLIWSGDTLFFSFKKNKFSCKITQGGLLWKCVWLKPDGTTLDLFRKSSVIEERAYVRTFESLTDWTETCIQECLDEYHTRYSSWKRVRHQRLSQTMETIYKHLQQKKNVTKSNVDNIALFEQIAALANKVEQQQKSIKIWEEWFIDRHPELPMPNSQGIVPIIPETSSSSSSVVQPFVLNTEVGQYMVLHRLAETAPEECQELIKSNGFQHFSSTLEEIKTAIVFSPPTDIVEENWAPVDESTIKNFVHRFFATRGPDPDNV
jgi:hypothetical protein